jgi:hypothetical protein
MSSFWISALGWTATAVFVSSYFFSRPSLLRAAQMAGSVLWITYGLLIGASPVIVANMLVFSAAAWTMIRGGAARASKGGAPMNQVT